MYVLEHISTTSDISRDLEQRGFDLLSPAAIDSWAQDYVGNPEEKETILRALQAMQIRFAPAVVEMVKVPETDQVYCKILP